MTPAPIPLLRLAGSHAEVGQQVGAATADVIRRTVDGTPLAAAAGVDPLAFFAASIEQLAPTGAPTGCSDIVVTGDRTADRHLLVAHNNDLYVECREIDPELREPTDARAGHLAACIRA